MAALYKRGTQQICAGRSLDDITMEGSRRGSEIYESERFS